MLGRWLDEDQEDAQFLVQLGAAAKQWDAKRRPAGLLWRGDAMEEARRWYASSTRQLAPRDQDFLDAVLSLAQRGRRARRIALIASFVVLGAVAGGASVAYVRVRAAEQEASENLTAANTKKAEAEAALHERDVQQAQREAEEKKRKAAEDERAKSEAALASAGKDLKLSAEELAIKNAELEKQTKTAEQAREAAEASSKKALAAAADAQKAKAELQVKLDAEKQRVKQLEDEKRKLSTKLKE